MSEFKKMISQMKECVERREYVEGRPFCPHVSPSLVARWLETLQTKSRQLEEVAAHLEETATLNRFDLEDIQLEEALRIAARLRE